MLFLCQNIFDRFLIWFQREGSLIHLLYHELFRLVLLQFLKFDYIAAKSGIDLIDLDFKLNEKQPNNKQICIGPVENCYFITFYLVICFFIYR